MQEVKVKQAINTTPVEGGTQIEVYGDTPPLVPLVANGLMTVILFWVGIANPEIGWLAWMGAAWVVFCFLFYKHHTKSQFVSIINGKLVVNDKGYDIEHISSIVFSNAMTKTTSGTLHTTSTTLVALTPSVGAAMGAGMGNALGGVMNAQMKSNAKKAFMVEAIFGNKKIKVAKNMRELTGLALYEELGRQLSMK